MLEKLKKYSAIQMISNAKFSGFICRNGDAAQFYIFLPAGMCYIEEAVNDNIGREIDEPCTAKEKMN